MIKLRDDHPKTVTANEFAKFQVADRGENAHYWDESNPELAALMTEKERQAVDEAISKQISRVWVFLGVSKIYHKGFNLKKN